MIWRRTLNCMTFIKFVLESGKHEGIVSYNAICYCTVGQLIVMSYTDWSKNHHVISGLI